jgi:hypothetical protein
VLGGGTRRRRRLQSDGQQKTEGMKQLLKVKKFLLKLHVVTTC